MALDAFDRALIAATQAGLPLVPRPYDAVGATLGVSGERVRRPGAGQTAAHRPGAPHWRGAPPLQAGLYRHGMSVWDVADAQVDALARQVAQLPGVSRCYLRPRSLPVWPYNLFAMLHRHSRGGVTDRRPTCPTAEAALPPARHSVFQCGAQKNRPAPEGRLTMFRISQYMRELAKAEATGQYPVVRDRRLARS